MMSSSPTLIRDPWRRLWRFFTSDGFLAAVFILCAALLLAAALLPQTPANDLVAYSRWLSDTQTRFGSLFEALNALGLFSITNSLIFRLALAVLGWCAALRLIEQLDRLRKPEVTARRSHLAAMMVYAGTLAALLGLVLGALIDYRVETSTGFAMPMPRNRPRPTASSRRRAKPSRSASRAAAVMFASNSPQS